MQNERENASLVRPQEEISGVTKGVEFQKDLQAEEILVKHRKKDLVPVSQNKEPKELESLAKKLQNAKDAYDSKQNNPENFFNRPYYISSQSQKELMEKPDKAEDYISERSLNLDQNNVSMGDQVDRYKF